MSLGSLPAVVAAAPDFTLPSTAGIDVTLSRLRGRRVLLTFFPLEDKFFSQRAYILVDRDGMVRWTHAEQTPRTGRENTEILEQLGRLS